VSKMWTRLASSLRPIGLSSFSFIFE
jgi:hypothetical protein